MNKTKVMRAALAPDRRSHLAA